MLFALLSKRFRLMTVLAGFAFVDIRANLLDCYSFYPQAVRAALSFVLSSTLVCPYTACYMTSVHRFGSFSVSFCRHPASLLLPISDAPQKTRLRLNAQPGFSFLISSRNYLFLFLMYSSIAAAARLPAPMARITVAAPVTASPPANTPSLEVMPCSSSATMQPLRLVSRPGVV